MDLSSVLRRDGSYSPENGEKAAEKNFVALVAVCKVILSSPYIHSLKLTDRQFESFVREVLFT